MPRKSGIYERGKSHLLKATSTKLRISLVIICVFLATACGVEAKNLVFPGTSVKELTAAGETWGSQTVVTLSEPGIGIRYSDANDEVGVALLDVPIPASTLSIFDASPGVLSAAQVADLAKRENPWILRYCSEGGKPYLAKFGKKKFIASEFIQEQRISVRGPGGRQCLSACKIEAHGFAVSQAKMVHIYWVRSQMRDEKTPPDAVLLKDVATKFRAMLETVRWE